MVDRVYIGVGNVQEAQPVACRAPRWHRDVLELELHPGRVWPTDVPLPDLRNAADRAHPRVEPGYGVAANWLCARGNEYR